MEPSYHSLCQTHASLMKTCYQQDYLDIHLNIFHFKPPGSHTIYLCIQNTQTVYPVLFNGVIKALILTDEVMQSLLTGKDVAE